MQASFVIEKPTQSVHKSFVLSQLSNSQKDLLGPAIKEDDSVYKILRTHYSFAEQKSNFRSDKLKTMIEKT